MGITQRLLAGLLVGAMVGASCGRAAAQTIRPEETNRFEIRSVVVDGKPLPLGHHQRLRLPSLPGTVTFGFGAVTNGIRGPLRLRYKLDGLEEAWHEVAGEMRLSVRFLDPRGDQVSEVLFRALGQTAGWTGTPQTSALVHRRERVPVPPTARGFWVVMSSAGPPTTVGMYVISNLTVRCAQATNPAPIISLTEAFGAMDEHPAPDSLPPGWLRDGLRLSMAQIVKLGPRRENRALAILDDDANGHVEWHTAKDPAPVVSPGDTLLLEWDEAYSLGLAEAAAIPYLELPAGYYRFRVNELTLQGTPCEAETSLALEVPLAFWKTPWFWVSVFTLALASAAGGWRYVVWHRLQRQLQRLEHQRLLERERLRIAQDIHDDLGARVTQISLLSAVAQRKPSLPDEARSDFGTISQMTRDLVSALYETVWAVNPENDNLEALANFLCQVGNQLCSQAQLRCRLEVPELPPSIPLSSQVRHNLIMAFKEAVHNIIKHARASEVRVCIAFDGSTLSLTIEDDGCGFDPAAQRAAGHGLGNLQRRLEDIGGRCRIESGHGRGTTVRLDLPVGEKG